MFAINRADFSCLCFSITHAVPQGGKPHDAALPWSSTPAVSTAHVPGTSGLKTSSNCTFLHSLIRGFHSPFEADGTSSAACAPQEKHCQGLSLPAWPPPTHTERRALGGRVLATVGAVDPVPLNQLVSRGVCPEVVSRLHLRVLQRTGPHCTEMKIANTRKSPVLFRRLWSLLRSPEPSVSEQGWWDSRQQAAGLAHIAAALCNSGEEFGGVSQPWH